VAHLHDQNEFWEEEGKAQKREIKELEEQIGVTKPRSLAGPLETPETTFRFVYFFGYKKQSKRDIHPDR
jgi:hypothetical protein